VLGDQRFSSRYELAHYPMPGAENVGEFPPAPPGDMTGIDAPEQHPLSQGSSSASSPFAGCAS